MDGTNTYTLTIPSRQCRLFKSLAREMGWTVEKPAAKKKACGMDKAMEDIEKGRIQTYESVEDFFNKMNI